RVLDVELVRRRYVNGFDRALTAELLDGGERLGAVVERKARPRLLAAVGAGDDLDQRVIGEGRHHQAERLAETGDSEADFAVSHGRLRVRLPGHELRHLPLKGGGRREAPDGGQTAGSNPLPNPPPCRGREREAVPA